MKFWSNKTYVTINFFKRTKGQLKDLLPKLENSVLNSLFLISCKWVILKATFKAVDRKLKGKFIKLLVFNDCLNKNDLVLPKVNKVNYKIKSKIYITLKKIFI